MITACLTNNNQNNMSLKYASLSALAAAIATERARPGTYRQAITDGIAAEAATIAQLETSLDPTTIDQLAASQARHAALSARLAEFDRFALEHREVALLDALCVADCEEIAALLEAERANRSKSSTGYFTKMADRYTAAARKFFGVEHTQAQLAEAATDSARIQAASDQKIYELATSESEIARFRNGPCWEFFNSANLAVKSLEFPV
ncbi:MAG: hypothetical protein WCO57_14200 [Verrucomicrobiota bacterium]